MIHNRKHGQSVRKKIAVSFGSNFIDSITSIRRVAKRELCGCQPELPNNFNATKS